MLKYNIKYLLLIIIFNESVIADKHYQHVNYKKKLQLFGRFVYFAWLIKKNNSILLNCKNKTKILFIMI